MADKMALFEEEKTPDEDNSVNDNDGENDAFEDYQAVNAELDTLNAALNNMESNVDNIREQLLELLTSNRELKEQLKQENQNKNSNDSGESDEAKENPMES
ncbi:unnamed protein product [Diamesa hyperborea]